MFVSELSRWWDDQGHQPAVWGQDWATEESSTQRWSQHQNVHSQGLPATDRLRPATGGGENRGETHWLIMSLTWRSFIPVTCFNIVCFLFRAQSLQWAARMVPLVHTEVRAHTVLQDHQDPPGLPWVHTTPVHTTRDLQDHSKYSSSFSVRVIINLMFKTLS